MNILMFSFTIYIVVTMLFIVLSYFSYLYNKMNCRGETCTSGIIVFNNSGIPYQGIEMKIYYISPFYKNRYEK